MKAKKLQVVLLCCFAFLCFFIMSGNVKAAEVDSGMCGEDVSWSLDDNGTLTLAGTGFTYDYDTLDAYSTPWYDSTVEITKIIIEPGITRIGDAVFSYCEQLTDISIPDSVSEIGQEAFFNCFNLKQIDLPENIKVSMYSFYFCGIENIYIPEGFTCESGIYDNPFGGCTNLEKIEVSPDNLYFHAENGVLYDDKMDVIICYPPSKRGDSFTIPDTVSTLGNKAFRTSKYLSTIVVPDNVTSIEAEVFYACEKLESVVLPENAALVVENGSFLFRECSNLKSVTLPKTLTVIGLQMFAECTSLESITLPEGVTYIEGGAFWGCTNLQKIIIPATVKEIKPDSEGYWGEAFENCDNLTIYGYTGSYAETYAKENNIPFVSLDGTSGEENDGDDNPVPETPAKEPPTQNYSPSPVVPSENVIPAVGENIVDVASNAVYRITDNVDGNLTVEYTKPSVQTAKVTIPSVVTIQGKNYQVTAIANKAFKNNKKVKKIVIPSTVKKIGKQAFFNCKKLKNIVIKTKKLKNNSIGKKAFKGISAKAVIKVPKTKQVVYRKILKKKGIIL